jgi:hypothetical protein
MKKTILFILCMFMFILTAYPQSTGHIISGRVLAEPGKESLSHVLIRAAKSKRAVTTEADGTFHMLIVQTPDTLISSHIGYETKRIRITDTTHILNIFLKLKVEQLEEVTINTGYQTAKPNEVNGSVATISNKLLNEQTGTNILQRLNGVTSGLAFSTGKSNGNPQNTTNITIRGLSTINGPLDPLIVLDNFIYEGDIKNINPNDVETLQF